MRSTTLRDLSVFLQNLYYLLESSAFLYISAQIHGHVLYNWKDDRQNDSDERRMINRCNRI